jgi:hypothetical protein
VDARGRQIQVEAEDIEVGERVGDGSDQLDSGHHGFSRSAGSRPTRAFTSWYAASPRA